MMVDLARRWKEHWKGKIVQKKSAYSRTHVVKNEDFELILLHWPKGSESPIHNHEFQRCWIQLLCIVAPRP